MQAVVAVMRQRVAVDALINEKNVFELTALFDLHLFKLLLQHLLIRLLRRWKGWTDEMQRVSAAV